MRGGLWIDYARIVIYLVCMTKTEAIRMFGTATRLARAIGITPQAVYQWPPVLTRALEDRVLAALARKNRPIPEQSDHRGAA